MNSLSKTTRIEMFYYDMFVIIVYCIITASCDVIQWLPDLLYIGGCRKNDQYGKFMIVWL